jgi:hypothetical protein
MFHSSNSETVLRTSAQGTCYHRSTCLHTNPGSLEIIDSILDYSKLEASGNCFLCLPMEEWILMSQFSPQARVYGLFRRRHHSCAFLSHSASYETYWDLGLHGIAPAHGCEKAGSLLQHRSRCTCMYACPLSAGRTILTFQFRGASWLYSHPSR